MKEFITPVSAEVMRGAFSLSPVVTGVKFSVKTLLTIVFPTETSDICCDEVDGCVLNTHSLSCEYVV